MWACLLRWSLCGYSISEPTANVCANDVLMEIMAQRGHKRITWQMTSRGLFPDDLATGDNHALR